MENSEPPEEGQDQSRNGGDIASALPHIPHTVVVMVMALEFHTKYTDGVGDSLNIFLFPNLSILAGSKSALIT